MLTWRSEYVPPSHQLRRMLAGAQKTGAATLISLPRLTPAAVGELARALASSSVVFPEELERRLYQETEGIPFFVGEINRALDLAPQALMLAEAANDAPALAQAHNILGILARHQGDFNKARGHLERGLTLAEELEDVSARIAALNNLALVYGASGEIEQALTLAEAALALCTPQGDRHREAALHNNLADLFHAAGRSEEAMVHLKQAVAIFSEIGGQAGAVQPEIWKLVEW